MKHFYLLIALLHAGSLFAQDSVLQRNKMGHVEIAEVIPADSLSSSQLFCNAKLFLNSVFANARETAQIRDEKTRTVATKGSFPVTVASETGEVRTGKTYFSLMIQAKDHFYKYTVYDLYFAHKEESGMTTYASLSDRQGLTMTKSQWRQLEIQAGEFFDSFIQDLKDYMQQRTIVCAEDMQANRKTRNRKE